MLGHLWYHFLVIRFSFFFVCLLAFSSDFYLFCSLQCYIFVFHFCGNYICHKNEKFWFSLPFPLLVICFFRFPFSHLFIQFFYPLLHLLNFLSCILVIIICNIKFSNIVKLMSYNCQYAVFLQSSLNHPIFVVILITEVNKFYTILKFQITRKFFNFWQSQLIFQYWTKNLVFSLYIYL